LQIWTAALRREALQLAANGEGRKLDLVARAVVRRAIEGDLAAAQEIGDRLEGKALSRQVVEGDGALLQGFAAILAAVNEERRRRLVAGASVVDVDHDEAPKTLRLDSDSSVTAA
jgi:hypothetical protein